LFLALDNAYKVLSDKEKRQEYDEETSQVSRRREAEEREGCVLILNDIIVV
jgi:DnaJ-class molecular chaperone